MKNKLTKLINGQIITPSEILQGYTLLINNGKIQEILPADIPVEEAETIDAKGNYIAPGCIDSHLHGGGGHDFLEATSEAFYTIARAHAMHGMTGIFATLAAAPVDLFKQAIKACEEVMEDSRDGAAILGLHLEGNYLNPAMAGGQHREYLYDPDIQEYKELLASSHTIKRWSASPELEGALDFARYATDRGVVVSLAHTVANYSLVKSAFEAGFVHATHFYNAMTGVHKVREFKYEGTIESIYLMDDMTVELVCDGIHVPPVIMKMVHRFKKPERIALVTDAMFAAAYDGSISDITDKLIIEDGVCKLSDRSALSSSIATADRMIRVMLKEVGVSLVDAIRMASETPARIMRIDDRKGSLEKGKDADIILFDENINILRTIVGGKTIYNPNSLL